ncbi:MAG: AAA family ATPase [Stenomitos frigidus ULC029]
MYEPCERVKVQTENPETQKSSFTLESLKIERTNLNDSLLIDGFSAQLNPNLVTIIGGRGSGKTALLDIVASCFREGEKLQNLETSFIRRLYTKKGKIKPLTSSIKTTLTFKSGESYMGEVGSSDFVPFERSDVLYLTQNHFEEYSANPGKLNSHILDLVFENLPDQMKKYEVEGQKIKLIEQEIQNINLKIEQLDIEVLEKEESLTNKLKVKVGEKDDVSLRITSIEEQQGQSDTIIRNLTDGLEELKKRKKNIEEMLSLFQQFESQITSFGSFYNKYVLTFNEQIKVFDDSENLKSLPDEIAGLREAKDVLSRNKTFLDEAREKNWNDVSIKNQEISELEGVSRTIAEFRRKVANLNAEIQKTEQDIKEIDTKKQQSIDLNVKRFQLYTEIMKMMSNIRYFFQQVIDEFESSKDEILNNLKFVAFIDMRGKSEYIQQVADKLDNRAHSQDDINRIFAEIFDSMESLMNADNSDNSDACILVSQKIENKIKNLRLKRSTTVSDYFNTVFRRFFDLGVEISFNDKSIDSLSMGERAIVLLKILLALDDKPLLIDQPEEHLDNRFIFNELVPAFRSAKKRRQIIIATHNANLVVNTDAEQIIVAESLEGTIRYSCGAIEDLDIRHKITQLLEGGESAFKKREEKYGYRF